MARAWRGHFLFPPGNINGWGKGWPRIRTIPTQKTRTLETLLTVAGPAILFHPGRCIKTSSSCRGGARKLAEPADKFLDKDLASPARNDKLDKDSAGRSSNQLELDKSRQAWQVLSATSKDELGKLEQARASLDKPDTGIG
eukprot:gene25331-biopygen22485